METHHVPGDRLIAPAHRFARPSSESVKARFERMHEASERVYHGGGAWGKRMLGEGYPPMYRNTAWRMIGYAEALKVEEDARYRERLMEGAEYLLGEQQANGSYLWWCYETHGHPDTDHLLYCTANPGVALLEVYRLTRDGRFLEASRRAADWAVGHGISRNNNYNSFAVWHLCEHYRVTGERKYLEAALLKNREGGFPNQLPNGAWAGHNAWIFYHAIIVRGFAALCGALPEDHESRPELRERTIMALNHTIEEQRGNGLFRSCFDPEEWEKSRNPKNPYSVHRPDTFDTHTLHTLVCVQDWTDFDLANALHGALASPCPDFPEDDGSSQLAFGAGYRWLAESQ